jgi:plasmid stabilization system protein ParE
VKGLVVSPAAEEDIFQIWKYLFMRGGVEVANRVEPEMLSAFDILADHPDLGHRRSDLTNAEVRFFAVYEYLIVYRNASEVEIVRVLHGRRNVRRIFAANQIGVVLSATPRKSPAPPHRSTGSSSVQYPKSRLPESAA